MDKVKLALIGAGERGQFNYAPYWKLHSHEMSFVAVAEPDRERRERFVREYRMRECLSGRRIFLPNRETATG